MEARLPYAPAALYPPQEKYWYSFLLEDKSTPGQIKRLEEFGKLKQFNNLIGKRTGDLPAFSIVPHSTTLPTVSAYNFIHSINLQ
jgi:hypothetical protein